MCIDLVAKHFLLATADTNIHSQSPLRFTDGNNHSWLFLDKEPALDGDVLRTLLEKHTSTPKWNINTYTKSLLTHPAITSCLRKDTASFDMLYTMSTELSDKRFEALETQPPLGWRIENGHDWYKETFPQKASLADHESVLVILDDAGRPGGFLLALSETQASRSRVYISDLFVFEEHRRKGLASALILGLIRKCRNQKSASVVCLTVFCENPGAVAAYIKLGLHVDDVVWVIGSK